MASPSSLQRRIGNAPSLPNVYWEAPPPYNRDPPLHKRELVRAFPLEGVMPSPPLGEGGPGEVGVFLIFLTFLNLFGVVQATKTSNFTS